MLASIWGIYGFYAADLMTEQHSFNTQDFLSHILAPLLLAVFPYGRKPHSPQLSLHLDNCRILRSKAPESFFAENSIIRVPHPFYSLGLAPSDFWLFGHMRAVLSGQQFLGQRIFSLAFRNF
jgi:hypothetical protein